MLLKSICYSIFLSIILLLFIISINNKNGNKHDFKIHNKLRRNIYYESNDDELHKIKLARLHADEILIKEDHKEHSKDEIETKTEDYIHESNPYHTFQ